MSRSPRRARPSSPRRSQARKVKSASRARRCRQEVVLAPPRRVSRCSGRCSRLLHRLRRAEPAGNAGHHRDDPQVVQPGNFNKLSRRIRPYESWYNNTMIICWRRASFTVFFSALAAYAFSRMRFTGRRGGLLALLLIQMFPRCSPSWRST